MNIGNVVNYIRYDDFFIDDCIKKLIIYYKENENRLYNKFEIYGAYKIKGNEFLFIGAFERDIDNERMIYYVFLKNTGIYRGDTRMEYKIFSCYDIMYLGKCEKIDKIFENIKICVNNSIYKFINEFLKK